MTEQAPKPNSMRDLVEEAHEDDLGDIRLWDDQTPPREAKVLSQRCAVNLAQALLDEAVEQDRTNDRALRARNVLIGREK